MISLLPLAKVSLFPWLYEVFKPALMMNLVIFDNSLLSEDETSDISKSFKNYEMPFPSTLKLLLITVVPVTILCCLCSAKRFC